MGLRVELRVELGVWVAIVDEFGMELGNWCVCVW